MRQSLLAIFLTIMSITAFGQTQINPKDYRFMVLQMPKLDMQFPENREIPADNNTFYALSYDDTNNTAFVYNDYVCGYYEVPAAMRAGFKTGARNLQAENPDEYWKLVKEVMDKVTANWKAKNAAAAPVASASAPANNTPATEAPKVLADYGRFADVRRFPQGTRPRFYQKISEASRRRAKQFVTKVGLAGRYEVFKHDGTELEVRTTAYGGAAQIAFEEFLDGRIQMSDVYDIVLEGMDEAVYKEIAKALVAMTANLPTHNMVVESSFVETEMDQLLQIADVYGKATIYCTFEFAATMLPQTGWVSDEMRNTRWANGYLGNYKSHDVIVLPQSFEDETNSVKVIDPSYAYIIPSGAEKPIKVAFEGDAQVKEIESQDDWSRVIHTYQKFGVAVVGLNPGLCAYRNTSLKKVIE